VDASRDDIYLKGICGGMVGTVTAMAIARCIEKEMVRGLFLHERFDAEPAMSGEGGHARRISRAPQPILLKRFLDGVDGFAEGVVVFPF
jgi:hypothetical protein